MATPAKPRFQPEIDTVPHRSCRAPFTRREICATARLLRAGIVVRGVVSSRGPGGHMDDQSKMIGVISEIAMDAASLTLYRGAVLRELRSFIGFDLATIQSIAAGADGDPPEFGETFARLHDHIVAEYLPDEVQRMASGRIQSAVEVFSKERRER